nr:hypothetical protein [Tanacetum cinerariifolium]
MANLTFADSYNMLANLEKSAENADFAEIVNFLNANPIRYALTVSPTIYVSYIEQFWSTAKTKQSIMKHKFVPKLMASLDAEQDSGTINRIQSMAIPNEPIPQGTSLGGSRMRQDTILGDRPAQTSAPISTASVSVSTAERSTPLIKTTTIIEDEELTIAQTLMKIRSEESKEKAKERGSKEKSRETATRPTKGVIMREASETTTRPTIPPQQKLDPKDKGKGKMVEPEKPLKKKDQIELDEERKREEEKTTKQSSKEESNVYLSKNVAGFTHNQLKNKSFKEVQKAFDNTMSWINCFVSMDSEVVKDRAKGSFKRSGDELESDKSKKQKLDEKVEAKVDNDQEEAEMKMYMKIVPNDESTNDYDSEGDIHFLEELLGNDSISLPENESSNFDHHDDPSFPRPPPEPPDVEFFFDFEPNSREKIATYGKVSYFDDFDYLKDFENEFPTIVYNDALTSGPEISSEPTALEKVTSIDLFYLKSMDVGSVNIPYLLAQYLRSYASGRKRGAMISSGQFVIDMDELVRFWICDRLVDTWAWVAPGPKRQQLATAGADEDDLVIPEGVSRLIRHPSHLRLLPRCWMREGLPKRIMLTTRYHTRDAELDEGLMTPAPQQPDP